RAIVAPGVHVGGGQHAPVHGRPIVGAYTAAPIPVSEFPVTRLKRKERLSHEDSVESPGACPCRGGGQRFSRAIDIRQRLRAGNTVETKRALHRFSAIGTRSLNAPRQGSSAPVQPLNP